MKRATALLTEMEAFQQWMAGHFRLDYDGVPFHEKKHKTSFMRRFAPDGVATGLVWTANIRALRHTIEMRTDPGPRRKSAWSSARSGRSCAPRRPRSSPITR